MTGLGEVGFEDRLFRLVRRRLRILAACPATLNPYVGIDFGVAAMCDVNYPKCTSIFGGRLMLNAA